jgi:hypothetical protein
LNIYASILTQDGEVHVALRCLEKGNCTTPAGAAINTYGSIASIGTGNLSSCLSADFSFDSRLATLRPPFFPVLDEGWRFTDWREIPEPCWVSGSCP